MLRLTADRTATVRQMIFAGALVQTFWLTLPRSRSMWVKKRWQQLDFHPVAHRPKVSIIVDRPAVCPVTAEQIFRVILKWNCDQGRTHSHTHSLCCAHIRPISQWAELLINANCNRVWLIIKKWLLNEIRTTVTKESLENYTKQYGSFKWLAKGGWYTQGGGKNERSPLGNKNRQKN